MIHKYSINRDMFDEVMVPNYSPGKKIPIKGKGSRVWDQDNKEYIDFAGGVAVSVLGHSHPKLLDILNEQGQLLWHLSNVLANEPAIKLAKNLINSTFAKKIFFANSGCEANEAALKLARKYTYDNYKYEKNEIISFKNSFHGRTLFTVSVGGQSKYTEGFGPLPSGITHVEFNNIKALKSKISKKTCAVIIEPIQGEGGIINANKKFLKDVRTLCNKHDVILIFDEIQTGIGRTGHLYAYMDYNVIPDILTSAKGLGCGFPISAMLTTNKIASSFKVGSHGSTYGGNPLGTAIANVIIDIVNTPEVLNGVKKKRDIIVKGINEINKKYNIFSEIRGKGLLIGCAVNDEWKGKAKKFVNEGLEQGLLLLIAGSDVIRITPSLIIPEDDIMEGIEKFKKTVDILIKNKS